jgi:hypothetical protein
MVYCAAGVVSTAAEYALSYVNGLVAADAPTETMAEDGEVRRVAVYDLPQLVQVAETGQIDVRHLAQVHAIDHFIEDYNV